MTYIVPAGEYLRAVNEATGRKAVVADSFHFIEQSPVSIGSVLLSFQRGVTAAGTIVAFLLLIGGAFGVVNATGAVEAMMAKFIVKFKTEKSRYVLISGLLLFFGLCAGIFGMSMESLVFAPFLISLMVAMGYDALLGIAIPVVGCAIGYGAAFLNPFNIGIAQNIAELPLFSGLPVRVLFFTCAFLVSALYLVNYATKIRKNPELSCCNGDVYEGKRIVDPESIHFSGKQKLVLTIFVVAIGVLVYGAMFRNFFMNECATVFFVMGVVAGLAYGMSPSEVAENFVKGASALVLAALIVGAARGIVVVLEEGQIIDTLIYYASESLRGLPAVISAPLMVLTQTMINLLVNSGSGQAVVTMPIMIPVGDLLEINRQVTVLAFQVGDGFSNMFWFTSGTLMDGLGIAKVGYGSWIKFVWKLMVMLLLLGATFVSAAQMMNWGPF